MALYYDQFTDPEDPTYPPPYVPEEEAPLTALPEDEKAPTQPAGTDPASPDFFPGGTFNGDYQGYFRSLFAGQTTLTGAQLKAKEAELAKAGMKVVTSASGNTAWVNVPGIGDVDVIGDYGGANTLQWGLPGQTNYGTDEMGIEGIDPSYLAPYETTFAQFYPSAYGVSADGLTPPEFASPGGFKAPTGESILRDPSYQFRLDQGRGQLENSAAARGLINSGGTLHDILNYGQQAASQEYGNIWNRDFNVWNADWRNALDEFGTKQGTNTSNYSRAWQQYEADRDRFYKNQDNPFSKIMRVGELGYSAAAS